MVKLRVEASQLGKLFKRRVLLIKTFGLMADRAHRTVRRIELRLMAACTIFVLRESRLYRVIATRVADRATPAPAERRVIARIRMREFGIVLWRGQKEHRFQKLRRRLSCFVVRDSDGALAGKEDEQRTDEEEKQDDKRQCATIVHAARVRNVRGSAFCL